jgi:hypothetical protein
VHLTLGILRQSQAVSYAFSFFQLGGFAVPAPAQVTQTVRCFMTHIKIPVTTIDGTAWVKVTWPDDAIGLVLNPKIIRSNEGVSLLLSFSREDSAPNKACTGRFADRQIGKRK